MIAFHYKMRFLDILREYEQVISSDDFSDWTFEEYKEQREYIMDTGERAYLLGFTEEEITINKDNVFHEWLMEGFRKIKRLD